MINYNLSKAYNSFSAEYVVSNKKAFPNSKCNCNGKSMKTVVKWCIFHHYHETTNLKSLCSVYLSFSFLIIKTIKNYWLLKKKVLLGWHKLKTTWLASQIIFQTYQLIKRCEKVSSEKGRNYLHIMIYFLNVLKSCTRILWIGTGNID